MIKRRRPVIVLVMGMLGFGVALLASSRLSQVLTALTVVMRNVPSAVPVRKFRKAEAQVRPLPRGGGEGR
jgi:hypothetical protein